MSRGFVLVISAPSGAGKSTLCRALLDRDPNLRLSISCTTRPPRPNEVHGKDYFFLTEKEFKAKADGGELLEWARVHDHFYGTPKGPIEEKLREGREILLNIDPQGARAVKESFPDSVRVYVVPPSWEILENRLRGRGLDDEAVVLKRLVNARNEVSHFEDYDYLVVNGELADAVDDLLSILRAERRRIFRLQAELARWK